MGASNLLVCALTLLAARHAEAAPSNRYGLVERQGMGIRDVKPQYPHDPYAGCRWWWDNDGSIACEDMPAEWGVSLETLISWNPSITPDCGGFIVGRSYCVEAPVTEPEPSTTTTTTNGSPPTTTTTTGNGITTPTSIQKGMIKTCNKFQEVTEDISCQDILDENKISLADFFNWNPAVGEFCNNLWKDTWACVGIIGGVATTNVPAPATTTKPANGIETPSPIQSGMTKSCNKFHFIETTTTCANLLDYEKITIEDLFKWNPGVKNDCTGLQAKTWACVGIIGGAAVTTTRPATTTKPANGIETPSPIQSGMVKNCNKFHDIKTTTTCANLLSYNKITLEELFKWNPGVKSDCTGLQAGTWACVGVIGGTTTTTRPATTTKPANGIETPSPIQSGMVKNCNKFHDIKTTTTCANLLSYNKITLEELFKWNPAVKSDCTGLQAGTWACVGVIGGTTTTARPSTTTKPANGIETPSPIQAGMVKNCNKFHDIKETTTCANLLSYNKITLADLYKWNPGVKSDCTGLQAGTWACVGVIGGSTTPAPPPTTTKPANGIDTPSPIQSGMVKNCNKFHNIKSTTTCANLLSYNKITLADLYKWNPGVKSDCTGLQADTWACVGVIGGTNKPTTTTKAGNGVATPTPIQAGMTKNCKKFHFIKSTTTCENLLSYNKITMAQLFAWNPAVKKDCTGLWEDTWACVGV
ncbi:LysM domain-containing protein [Colletotrichum truncatum]|uniref:LysM domain-containing protein n=1 Tax=Colletotrichum truncatum TaxID=5467 RepID=A0ACC3YDB2_COLTU|nr:LysM domain-containing protein [Colletotrichum truncatum]KAF6784854.1 LysM domain-containing protein [Colletotrichum truncatum]